MYILRQYIFFLLCLLVAEISLASDLQFRKYTTDNQLPSNCIRDILQTSDGFMWIAADGGLVRFDGYTFKPYPLKGVRDGREDTYVMALCQCGDVLIAGSDNHLYRYDITTDAFIEIPLTIDSKPIERIDIRKIACDIDGNLWLSVIGQGLYKTDITGKGRQYHFPQYNGFVADIYIDSKGDVWTVSNQNDGEILRYDRATDNFKRFGDATMSHNALAITEDHNHDLWLGTWDDGLICFNSATGRIIYKTPENEREYMRHIHSLLLMPDGRLFVGSDDGLVIMDSSTKAIRHYDSDIADANSLSDRFIYPIKTDREGGIWIGTYYGGVNYLRPELKLFDRLEPSAHRGALNCKIISDIQEDRFGKIWIASDDDGLYCYDPKSSKARHIDLKLDGQFTCTSPTNLHTLCFDGDDLWIGTYSNGVLIYNTTTGECRQIHANDDNDRQLMSMNSYAIYRDRRAQMWVAIGSTINRYDRVTDSLVSLRDIGGQIVDIKEDVDGTLWMATHGGGLWRYDTQRGQWSKYTYSPENGSIPHDHVNCICVDSQNNVLVATAQGLCRYNRATDTFSPIDLCIKPSTVYSLVEDDGVLWITTDTGLIKFKEGEVCEVFTKNDGLSSQLFNYNSILKSSSGRIYVGTRFGITAFYPYQIKSNTLVPNVVLTAFEVPGSKHTDSHNHYVGSLSIAEEVTVHPEDKTFSISFAALSYTNPDKNQYSYRLDGFDNDWISVGAENKVTYTNLSPGTYTFRVKASNSDNIWNDQGASIKVIVKAPWYWSTPMRLIYLLLIIGAITCCVLYIIRRNDNKHKVEINQINSDKELEVYQSKMSFFTMIAHEIRTPVSLIIGPLENVMRSPERVPTSIARDLGIIERNSQRLLFLVNQLLDFKKVEESAFTFHFRQTRIKSLLMEITERFNPSMEQRGIKLNVACGVDDDFTVDIDQEGVTKLLSNLLNNARKFTHDVVNVSLTTDDGGKNFIISVSDNGGGISKENISKIFVPFYQVDKKDKTDNGGTGLGLSIVKNMVEGHSGTIEVDSEVGKGATFTVSLPVHQAAVEKVPTSSDVATVNDGKIEEVEKRQSAQTKPMMLVVDDNEELCTFIADNFREKYDVTTAHDGMEALEILRSKNVSLVISDWMMPRLDGAELCKAVRADRNISHIPFVLLTAKTDNISRIEGLNIGADAYVDKPFSVQVLEARIDNLLNMRALLRSKFSQQPLQPLASVAPNAADNEILTQLTTVIEENFANPDLDIDFLAAKLDISRSGLYNKIRALVDTTPNELIRITRLKHAAKLLSENRYRINEVCYMVGFNSTSYFAKCFQKQFGMTPTEFIANISSGQ